MRRFAPLIVLALPFTSCASPGPDDPAPGIRHHRLSASFGARTLGDSDVWGPVEDESVFGLQYAHLGAGGFGIELGLLGSGGFERRFSSNVDVTGAVAEVFGGLQKEFRYGDWRPYLGAGAAFVAAGIDNDSGGAVADDQDTSFGYYGHAGLLFDLTPSAYFGVDLRILDGTKIDFETIEGDANYGQVTLVVGTSF